MASTTGISLDTLSQRENAFSATGTATMSRRKVTLTSNIEEDEAAILEASLAADSEAPDGGYGWAVVLGGGMLMWWSSGTTYAWGVIQRKLVDDGLAGPAVLSFVGSTQAAMVSVFAVLDAWLIRQYLGGRVAGMLGITIMGISAILASFTVANRPGLFVTFGFMAGAGASFGFAVVAAIPAQYFSTKRGLANGLIFAGSGFGGATNSFVMDIVIRRAGLPMAFRVLGLVTLATGLPAAWLMKERIPIPSRQFVEWRLFRTVNFTFLWCAAAVGNFPIFVPPFFLPLYTKALGLSSSAGAGLVAGFTLSSAVGRIFCGFCCDRIGPVNVLLGSLLLSAVSMLAIWPASQTIGPLALFVVTNGVSNGGFFSTTPTVASSVFGSARVSVVMGMIMTGWIGGYLLGSPIAGFLLEAFGGAEGGLKAYRPAMLYAGSLAALSAALLLVVRLRINSRFWAKV